MYRFRMYIPFARDLDLLNKCVNSVVPQINEFSNFEGKKIVVINNSMKPITGLDNQEAIEIWELPFELTHAQEMNWMLRASHENEEVFCMTTHTDSELLSGAMENLVSRWEEIKDDPKWACVISPNWGAIFCAFNTNFYYDENVWYDPFLFPFYYMDNHMGRLIKLRGWHEYYGHGDKPFIKHKSSHFLKDDRVFCRKNECAFGPHGQIYANIWGGPPGGEKINDPYANGTLPRKE